MIFKHGSSQLNGASNQCMTRVFPFRCRPGLFNRCMSASLNGCMRLARFIPKFPRTAPSIARKAARMVKLLYCFVSSPDNNGDTSSRLPAQNFHSITILRRLHWLDVPRRQSRFAHHDFCTSRIVLKLKTQTTLAVNNAHAALKWRNNICLASMVVHAQPSRDFQLATSSQHLVKNMHGATHRCHLHAPRIPQSSDSLQNSAELAVPFRFIAC